MINALEISFVTQRTFKKKKKIRKKKNGNGMSLTTHKTHQSINQWCGIEKYNNNKKKKKKEKKRSITTTQKVVQRSTQDKT